MNILDLLQQDGITAKMVSSTHGGEFASPCPACGGSDRFRCWPAQGKGGRWWCRQCNRNGDLIQYLRDIRGKSFHQASTILGLELAEWKPIRSTTLKYSKEHRVAAPAKMPQSEWVQKASSFLQWSQDQLHSGNWQSIRSWLGKRGISADTVKSARLGWNPKDFWIARKTWGLPEELNEKGKPKKLWLPRGITIPNFRNGELQRIRIRRAEGDPKYYVIPGSVPSSMCLGALQRIFVIVESELDAFLVHQEAGDLVCVVALGSANIRPDKEVADMLLSADLILISLDSDDAGGRQAWQWWLQRFANSKRWPVPNYKDPGEAFQAGLDLRLWVQAAVHPLKDSPALETPATKEQIESCGSDSLFDYLLRSMNSGGFYARYWPNVRTYASKELTSEQFSKLEALFIGGNQVLFESSRDGIRAFEGRRIP